MLGIIALATNALLNPTMQAYLRYYPEYIRAGNASGICRVARKRILQTWGWAVPVVLPLTLVGFQLNWFNEVEMSLMVVLVLIDSMRMLRTTTLNASRRHRAFGAWHVCEAWGRPAFAYVMVLVLGATVSAVLFGFVMASALLYGVMARIDASQFNGVAAAEGGDIELLKKFSAYSTPLLPIGLLGWISGMADRYMIGAFLSAREVGMYAAAYGLASRPLLTLSTVAELVVRPAYYSALHKHDVTAIKKYLGAWLAIVIFIGGFTCIVFVTYHTEIASILLGAEFRSASNLMPYIAVGYLVLALAHIPTRVCYAHDDTRAVLTIELAAAFLAVAVGLPFIYQFGLLGGAIAVPVYFFMQLTLSLYLAKRSVGGGMFV